MSIPVVLPAHQCTPDNFLESLFSALALTRRHECRSVAIEHWAVAATALRSEDRQGALKLTEDGRRQVALIERSEALLLLQIHRGSLWVCVAAKSDDLVGTILEDLHRRYPVDRPGAGSVIPLVFWAKAPDRVNRWRRNIEVPSWPGMAGNYPAKTATPLEALMNWSRPSQGGQLLLWYGQPGTGKTWALRALASEWRSWCQFEYITDPDKMFEDASYLTTVLLADEDAPPAATPEATPERWRCLILEDTGELLALDAKARQGQGLSRLLNVVDGLLGQGLRLLLLITTNEEIKALHPAVTRPGRCLFQVTFAPFTAEQGQAWLAERRQSQFIGLNGSTTLAELYHHLAQYPLPSDAAAPRVGFRLPGYDRAVR